MGPDEDEDRPRRGKGLPAAKVRQCRQKPPERVRWICVGSYSPGSLSNAPSGRGRDFFRGLARQAFRFQSLTVRSECLFSFRVVRQRGFCLDFLKSFASLALALRKLPWRGPIARRLRHCVLSVQSAGFLGASSKLDRLENLLLAFLFPGLGLQILSDTLEERMP